MKKQKAFTLVELIVVITILAILGTVAFISLQGYTREARDSKRLSDINNIQKKIGIEIVKGTSLSSLINLVKTNSGLTINSASGTSIQGTANFQTLKEDGSKFKDPITGGDYVVSYSVGGTGTGAYKFTQVSTINEENNQAVVKGNYYQMQTGDSIGIIKNDSDSFVINEGSNLPYEPVAGGGDALGPIYTCDDTSKPDNNGHITYVEGTPTSTNQVYIQDSLNCGYSCTDSYTGTSCEIAPITSGFIATFFADSGVGTDSSFNYSNTGITDWNTLYAQTINIGTFNYIDLSSPNASLPLTPWHTIQYDKNWVIRFDGWNDSWMNDFATIEIIYLDSNNTEIARVEQYRNATYSHGIKYSLDGGANWVIPTRTNPYSRVYGDVTITDDSFTYVAQPSGTYYVNNFSFTADFTNLKEIRVRGSAYSTYSGAGGRSWTGLRIVNYLN